MSATKHHLLDITKLKEGDVFAKLGLYPHNKNLTSRNDIRETKEKHNSQGTLNNSRLLSYITSRFTEQQGERLNYWYTFPFREL